MTATKRELALLISDREFAENSVSDKEKQFRQLYHQHVQKVRSTLVRLAGGAHLDDMTQEIFIKIWQHFDNLQELSSVSAWIYRITVNVAYDHLRVKKRWHLQPLTEEMLTASDDYSQFENRHFVKMALESLDFAHLSVLVLHDLEQLCQKEIAEALDIPIGTVKSRLFNARAKVRAFLSAKGVQL